MQKSHWRLWLFFLPRYVNLAELCYNNCKVSMGTFKYFCLEFFLTIDQWKVFKKNKLVFGPTFWYLIPHFLPPCTLVLVLRGTSCLDHRTILSDGRLLFISIIVKILIINSLYFSKKIKKTKFSFFPRVGDQRLRENKKL